METTDQNKESNQGHMYVIKKELLNREYRKGAINNYFIISFFWGVGGILFAEKVCP